MATFNCNHCDKPINPDDFFVTTNDDAQEWMIHVDVSMHQFTEVNSRSGKPNRRSEDPGILAFPRVSICLDCGASRFSTPDAELRILRERYPCPGG